MKKVYEFLVFLFLIIPIGPAIGQDSLIQEDSVNVSALSQTKTLPANPNIIGNRIPVKAGDSITITAVVQEHSVQKGRFWKNIGRAIVPSLIVNRLSKKQSSSSIDQITTVDAASFGASLAIVPSAIEVLKSSSKTMVGLAVYDSANRQIAIVSDFMTKAAQKDWEELRINYRVEKDGFVEIFGNKDKNLSFVNFGQDKWMQVIKYSGGIPKSTPTPGTNTPTHTEPVPSIAGGNSPGTTNPPVPTQTASVRQTCTAWFWCNSFGCEFIGISCQDDFDSGDGGGGGGIVNTYDPVKCAACKRLAQNEYDKNLSLAKTALTVAVSAGCHIAGASTFISFNTAGWWVNLIPGIGTAAIEALSALGGLVVDVSCLVSAVQTFNAVKATLDNNLFKDMNDCDDKYCR